MATRRRQRVTDFTLAEMFASPASFILKTTEHNRFGKRQSDFFFLNFSIIFSELITNKTKQVSKERKESRAELLDEVYEQEL